MNAEKNLPTTDPVAEEAESNQNQSDANQSQDNNESMEIRAMREAIKQDKIGYWNVIKQKCRAMQTTIDNFLHWQTERAPFALGIEIMRNYEQVELFSIYVQFVDVGLRCRSDGSGEFLRMNNSKAPPILRSLLFRGEEREGLPLNLENALLGINMTHCTAIVCSSVHEKVAAIANHHDIPVIECFESLLTRCMEGVFEIPDIASAFNEVESQSDFVLQPTCIWAKFDWLEELLLREHKTDPIGSTSSSWNLMRALVTYIKPLKLTLDTVAKEPTPLASMVRPMTIRLLEKYFPSPDDARSETNQLHSSLIDVRELIVGVLKNRILSNAFLREATYMDPRFRHDYIEKHSLVRSALEKAICERFKKHENAFAPAVAMFAEYNDAGLVQRESSLKAFLDRPPISAELHAALMESKLDEELRRYHCELPLDLNECAVVWWRKNATNYRQLQPMAQRYICVHPCVNRLYRYDAAERFSWQHKRLRRREYSTVESTLWYVNYNIEFYCELNFDLTGEVEEVL